MTMEKKQPFEDASHITNHDFPGSHVSVYFGYNTYTYIHSHIYIYIYIYIHTRIGRETRVQPEAPKTALPLLR